MDTLPNIHSLIRQRLNALRQKDKIAAIFQGLLITVSASLVLGLIGVVTESLFRLETYGRSTLDLILLLIALGIVVWYVLRPFYSLFFKPDTPDDDSLALRVGEKYPHIKDKLVNALQVFRKHTHNPEGYSLELVDASLLEIAEEVKELDFHTVVDYRPLKKMGQWAGIIFAGCLIFWVAFWSPLSDASYRLLHPFTEFKVAPQFTLKVLPGNIEVLKGETVKIQALVEGKQPVDELILTLKRVDNGVEQHKILQPESPGRFQYLIENIKDSTEYFVRAQSVVSSKYLISVIELPMVRNLRLKLTYPAYSRLETRFLDENVGDVTALKGTQVQVTIKANKGLEKAELVFDGKTITEMKVSGLEAKGNFTLRKDGSYHIRLTDGQGNTNQDPIEYRLAVIEDQYPTVRIPVPGMDMDMGEDMRLFLVIEAEDDFGFSSARLGYRIIREGVHAEKDSHYINFQLPPAQNEKIGFNYDWDLSELNLMPEDVVNYFAEVFDNDLVSGPKNTRSLTYRVRFPSLQEIYAEVEKEHQETFQSLEGMYEQSKQLKEKLDQIVQEMKKDPNLNWEEKKQVEEALKTQQKMQQELEEVQKKLDEMIERMEKNELLSLETLQKYRELQQLFQEIMTPELRKALEELQKAIEQIDPSQLQRAMEKFQLTQEELLQSLERTINILKRLQIEQKLDEAVKKTEELLQRQKELLEKAKEASKDQAGDLAQQEKEIKEDAEDLKNTVQDLKNKMSEFPQMPLARIEAALEMMENQNLTGQMQEASQMFQAGDMKGGQKQGQQITHSLQELAEMLKTAQKELNENQKREVMEALRHATHDLLNLSKGQEDILGQSQELDQNSPQFRTLAEKQHDLLAGLSRVAENLLQLSQKTFFVTPEIGKAVGKSLAHMNAALQSLEERNGNSASQHQGQAMGSLNEAVKQMRRSMQSLSGASSAMGLEEFMNQLQAMAGQQQGINQQTLELNQGGQLTLEQQAAMARLAAEQEALRKSLEQLLREVGDRSEILGRLDQVGQEMEQVVKDLQQQKVDRKTIERQERILSRLLDAQRSAKQRDYSRQRQAERGKEYRVKSPAQLPPNLGERQYQLQEDLLKALKEGYSRDYRELIKKYFEALAKENTYETQEK